MIQLRDYQQAAIDGIRRAFAAGRRRVLHVLPTGGGKTTTFAYIATRAAERQQRVWILAHRVELLDQISATLDGFGCSHGFIAAGYPARVGALVQVAGVFTVARRLDRVQPPDLIVVDEAHHAVAATTWGRILSKFPRARILGVTATPCRTDGSGLDECFDTLVEGPTVAELTARGFLVPLRAFAPASIATDGIAKRYGDFQKSQLEAVADTSTVTGDAVAHYQRHALGKRAVVFCVSVKHAEHVAEQFRGAGIAAKSVDGGMDRELRRSVLRAFASGSLPVLTSCDLVSEGFDLPALEVGISLRPTQSLALWLQQIGRVLRPAPGKTEALLFDHAGNLARHGWPDDPREWSLAAGAGERKAKAADDEADVAVRICDACFAAFKAFRTSCPECGAAVKAKAREVEVVAGTLEEVTPEDRDRMRRERAKEQGAARDLPALIELGKKRGYKNPVAWAGHILASRERRGAA